VVSIGRRNADQFATTDRRPRWQRGERGAAAR
jgi:hypothetical protein